ncbi:BING4CGT (NU131) domain-containing protein [Spironucleus salmonicida]|uniref:BING4CGT (NU131) domain-containing protein n=1 Tax=Spironucleus salmonicida TaxID=348837 RepID=V6LC00_9EUKA|nr:BING4CGT (NU131) domain-containing protein [Spironucleus salmonicida]|eukprot:EST41748.1 BING4CGT (NU131) domain-containing protein [Spironucleus salmonicida]
MYQFGSLTVKKSSIQPISQKQLSSKNLEEQRGIFNSEKLYTQDEIKKVVPPQLQKQIFSLQLNQGPYMTSYDPSGQHLLIAGSNSHVSLIRLEDFTPIYEKNLDMKCYSCQFLTNSELQAFGRQGSIGITNLQGNEVHRLPRGGRVVSMDYLTNHMLLVDASSNQLSYTDITNGKQVAQIKQANSFKNIATDFRTALIGTASYNSNIVKAYAPKLDSPAYAIDIGFMADKLKYSYNGNFLLAQGAGKVKIYDVRETKTEICSVQYSGICSDFDVSQTGKLALLTQKGVGVRDINSLIQDFHDSKVVKDAKGEMHTPFNSSLELFHQTVGSHCHFRPFFDNLVVSGDLNIEQILVPGSGSQDFNTFQSNMFSTVHTRNEQLIKNQLDKLPWDLIGQSAALTQVHKPTIDEIVKQKNDLLVQQIAGQLSKKTRKEKPKTVRQKQMKVRSERKIQLQMLEQKEVLQRQSAINEGKKYQVPKTGINRFERME